MGGASFFFRYDTGNHDLVTGNVLFFRQTIKKGAEAPFFVATNLGWLRVLLGRTGASEHSKRVTPSKAVALAGLVTHVACIKITVH